MDGQKPRRSRIRTAFVVVAAALGIGATGGVLETLPKDQDTGTQKVTTFQNVNGVKYGYNISPSDQLWKQTLGMRSVQERGGDLIAAASAGDNWRVQALINSPDSTALVYGDAPNRALEQAALRGHAQTVSILIAQADANPMTNYSQPLINAVRSGNEDAVKILLNNGAHAKAQNSEALIIATAQNNLYMTKLLLAAGADASAQNSRALAFAAANNNTEMTLALLAADASATAGNSEAAHIAAANGNLDVLKALVKYGADVGADNSEALFQAVANGRYETARFLLLERSVKAINADGSVSKTPLSRLPQNFLMNAAVGGYLADIVPSVDIHANNEQALRAAVANRDVDMIGMLMANGANANVDNGALKKFAQDTKDPEMIRLLNWTRQPLAVPPAPPPLSPPPAGP